MQQPDTHVHTQHHVTTLLLCVISIPVMTPLCACCFKGNTALITTPLSGACEQIWCIQYVSVSVRLSFICISHTVSLGLYGAWLSLRGGRFSSQTEADLFTQLGRSQSVCVCVCFCGCACMHVCVCECAKVRTSWYCGSQGWGPVSAANVMYNKTLR